VLGLAVQTAHTWIRPSARHSAEHNRSSLGSSHQTQHCIDAESAEPLVVDMSRSMVAVVVVVVVAVEGEEAWLQHTSVQLAGEQGYNWVGAKVFGTSEAGVGSPPHTAHQPVVGLQYTKPV